MGGNVAPGGRADGCGDLDLVRVAAGPAALLGGRAGAVAGGGRGRSGRGGGEGPSCGALLAGDVAEGHHGHVVQQPVGQARLDAHAGLDHGLLGGLEGGPERRPGGQGTVGGQDAVEQRALVAPGGQTARNLDQAGDLGSGGGRRAGQGLGLGAKRRHALGGPVQVVRMEHRGVQPIGLQVAQSGHQVFAEGRRPGLGHVAEACTLGAVQSLQGQRLADVQALDAGDAAHRVPHRLRRGHPCAQRGGQIGGQGLDPRARIPGRGAGGGGVRHGLGRVGLATAGEGQQGGGRQEQGATERNRGRGAHGGRLFTRSAGRAHGARRPRGD
jgi:hypothetical protein